MEHRDSDRHDADFREQRQTEPSGTSAWAKFIISGLIAGLLAWGGMSSRMSSIETTIKALSDRATEDRGLLRESTDRLTVEISRLRDDLQAERVQRVIDRSTETHTAFPRGKIFDK